jgi:hypothetical protein
MSVPGPPTPKPATPVMAQERAGSVCPRLDSAHAGRRVAIPPTNPRILRSSKRPPWPSLGPTPIAPSGPRRHAPPNGSRLSCGRDGTWRTVWLSASSTAPWRTTERCCGARQLQAPVRLHRHRGSRSRVLRAQYGHMVAAEESQRRRTAPYPRRERARVSVTVAAHPPSSGMERSQ